MVFLVIKKGKNLLVLNLFGAPGAGKSTAAHGIVSELKMLGAEVEMASEYAKILNFTERKYDAGRQIHVFSKQEYMLDAFRASNVEIVVTDSPLINSVIYKPENYYKSFDNFVLDVFNSFENINFLLCRKHKYSTLGRWQSEEDADKIHKRIESTLTMNNIKYTTLNSGTKLAIKDIVSFLKPKVEEIILLRK